MLSYAEACEYMSATRERESGASRRERERPAFTSCEAYFGFMEERGLDDSVSASRISINPGVLEDMEEATYEALMDELPSKNSYTTPQVIRTIAERYGITIWLRCGECVNCESIRERNYMDALTDDHPNAINMGDDY